jgi:hypothetical protein
LKLIRLLVAVMMVVVLGSCEETPTEPGPPEPPPAPANITLTVQQGNANPSAELFEGNPQQAFFARYTFQWFNDGGSPGIITAAAFGARHLGGRDVTQALNLAENNTVLPNAQLIFEYDYFYAADTGAANSRLVDFQGTSAWSDPTNNITGTANTAFLPANNDQVAPDTRPCLPGSATACLRDGRFTVKVDWQTPQGTMAAGNVHSDTNNETAAFWFFNANNVEALLQVLDRCPVNDRFWVFAAATTNVDLTLRVTDTQTGQVRTYFNPTGQVPPAITDTDAFATCPGPLPIPVP